MTVMDAARVDRIAEEVDFVFCAVDMPKDQIRELETAYARTETPVVSNNSAFRMVDDVPMMIPEVNAHHMAVIEAQRRRLGTKVGFVTCKPNCSIQGYVPALEPLKEFGLEKVMVATYQAISGAGKTFRTWPEMADNVIPYIGGEEQKSEQEPSISGHAFRADASFGPEARISAHCYRERSRTATWQRDGGLCKKAFEEEIQHRWAAFEGFAEVQTAQRAGEVPDLL
jgi:aspartate-semialdehyde dehydrogenase